MNFDINQYRWKNRLIVVMSHSNDNELFQQFKHDYERYQKDIKERKLVRKIIVKPRLQPKFQITIYTLDGKFYRKITRQISMKDLLTIIDQMPIRKAEIRKKQKTIRL